MNNSFSSSIKNVFDSLFVASPSDYTLEGLNRESGISNLNTESHKIKAEELDAIKQSTSKGFRVIDINPNLLSREDFYCIYSDLILKTYVGFENLNEGTNPPNVYDMKYDNTGSPVNDQPVQSPYWRTLVLPVVGNFLKVEFLPIRQNVCPFSADVGNVQTDVNFEPQNTLEFLSGLYESAPNIAGTDMNLLEFENSTDKPLIVKNGDCFETYFTNVILTFKQQSPLIRLTIGYNSKIIENQDSPQTLHLWNGKSYTKQALQPPKAFCINDRDVTNPIFYGGLAPNPVLGGMNYYALIQAIGGLGGSIIWITGFNTWLEMTAASTAQKSFELSLYIGNQTGATPNLFERVLTAYSSVTSTNVYNNVTPQIIEPIRVQLKDGENLYLRIFTVQNGATAGNPFLKFSLTGYANSALTGVPIDPVFLPLDVATPFFTSKTLTENPYPTDLQRFRTPNT